MNVPEIDPVALKVELESGKVPHLLDVREPDEIEVSALPNIVSIPLGQLPERFTELDRDADWVVICRAGRRSEQAVEFLLGQGFQTVRNMTSGMNGWAAANDPSMPVA